MVIFAHCLSCRKQSVRVWLIMKSFLIGKRGEDFLFRIGDAALCGIRAGEIEQLLARFSVLLYRLSKPVRLTMPVGAGGKQKLFSIFDCRFSNLMPSYSNGLQKRTANNQAC